MACGAGWSLATVAATLVLQPGLRSRASLAAHDGLLVLGALAGILLDLTGFATPTINRISGLTMS